MTAEQLLEVERQTWAGRFCSSPRRAKRLSNRLMDMPKQKFVDQFVATGKIDAYPYYDEDVADENGFVPPEGLPTVRDVLVEQVRRAFEVTHLRKGPEPQQVAFDLLCSDCSGLLSDVEHASLNELSVPLLLAHVEALGFDLPERTAISVARRCMIVLLNASKMRREP